MIKKIFLFLVLPIVSLSINTCQPVFAQSSTEFENIQSESIITKPRFRIVFEGTFQKSRNYGTQGMNTGDYMNNSIQSPFSSTTNPFLQNQSFSTDYGFLNYQNNYGSNSSYKSILIGFDTDITRNNGRRFVFSTRSRFVSNLEPNSTSKETWLKFHTEGKKQSSLVVDFNIRIIR